MAAILTFKYTEGAGVEDYSSMGGGGGGEYPPPPKSRLLPNRLRPYKVVLTLMQDVLAARNAKRSISTILQKNRGLWTVYKFRFLGMKHTGVLLLSLDASPWP